MTVQELKDFARRVAEALNRRDYAALDDLFAPDVGGHHPYGLMTGKSGIGVA